jgi:ferredoxin
MKRPVVELSDCILCEVCTEICPSVFRMNDAGYVEVITLETYPEGEVDEAIKNCPKDCIFWEE